METSRGKTREEIINRLADRIDSFEKYTQPHSRLIAELATRLARRFGLASADVDAIGEAAMLHDIGLYAMSPAYHSAPRTLSFEARLDLWRHPVIGEQQMGKREANRHAQLLVRWHHEWWNGSGYPDMLAFEDIPIGARILRAVELYSALIADRPYRPALNDEQVIETLTSSAGIECDPYVIKALLTLLDELRVKPADFEAPAIEYELSPGSPIAESAPTETSRDFDLSSDTSGSNLNPSVVSHPSNAEAEIPLATNSSASRPGQSSLPRSVPADTTVGDAPQWQGWIRSRYNKKTLLGFQASVLRQIEFRSIAFGFWNQTRLDLYLKTWGKVIFANDPRSWTSTLARAAVEASEPLDEELIARLVEDVYVPGVKLANPDLRRWFGETDAWWMDNLRKNIDTLEDRLARAQALALGIQTGDYALSFDETTREIRQPLTTVFWRLAGRSLQGPAAHTQNRSFNYPVEEFIKHARADLLYMSLPSSHDEQDRAEARSKWRESWVRGASSHEADQAANLAPPPQSKQSYLASIDRWLRLASHFRAWAIEYQEPGMATAQDLVELIKEYRPVRATYSKDVTEVAGGLHSYIIVGEKSSAR
ncbi:MAG TPA: HD domain-containing phosphohydrolase [Blastocatellia bacterium]|nr:HD domain-containing phosphohydrolase [Blastocatellia bacterium]